MLARKIGTPTLMTSWVKVSSQHNANKFDYNANNFDYDANNFDLWHNNFTFFIWLWSAVDLDTRTRDAQDTDPNDGGQANSQDGDEVETVARALDNLKSKIRFRF